MVARSFRGCLLPGDHDPTSSTVLRLVQRAVCIIVSLEHEGYVRVIRFWPVGALMGTGVLETCLLVAAPAIFY